MKLKLKRLDAVKKILDFNNQKQIGQGLKILTPDQMLSRLPITWAQLKAGNKTIIAFFVSFKKLNQNNL